MTEMIERVAQALKDSGLREDYDVRLALARAAIEAMREPTKEMIDEGNRRISVSATENTRVTWHNMIDEALKD